MGESQLCVVLGDWGGGALSGRFGRWLPWKQSDSLCKGWRDGGGVNRVTVSEIDE